MNNFFVTVQCRNRSCGMRECTLTTFCTNEAHLKSESENWRYCPSCQRQTKFQCPECKDWHEISYLPTKPYVCPSVVKTAIEKYNSIYSAWKVIAVFFAGFAVPLFSILPYGEVKIWEKITFLGYTIPASNFATYNILFIPIIWIFGGIWVHCINKKRKAKFAKDFPKEWELVQRFQNSLN